MNFPYSVLHRPDPENPVFPEGFGLQIDTSQCPDLNQLRQALGGKIIEWIDRYGFVHLTQVRNVSIPDEFPQGRTGSRPTLWHVDRGPDIIVALGDHNGDGAPTRFVVRDDARKIMHNSTCMHHLRDAPIRRTPSLELSLQTAYELAFKISDGTHAVILGLASEINQADSVVEIDWTQHPDGMVFFRSEGPKGDRVLHGCFPSNDLEGMSMNMNRSLRYYENLEKFLGTSQSVANVY